MYRHGALGRAQPRYYTIGRGDAQSRWRRFSSLSQAKIDILCYTLPSQVTGRRHAQLITRSTISRWSQTLRRLTSLLLALTIAALLAPVGALAQDSGWDERRTDRFAIL